MHFDTEVLKPKSASKDITEFLCESGFISHLKHTPFAVEGSELHRTTYTYESQYGTHPSSVWTSH
jgi:hypothetical protein